MSRTAIRRISAAATALILGAGGALLATSPAFALDHVVENLDNAGDGSLRAAILDANANPGPDRVVFAEGLTGTIMLDSAIEILEGVEIVGPGADALRIQGTADFDDLEAYGIAGDLVISGIHFAGGPETNGRAITVAGIQGDVIFTGLRFTDFSRDENGGAVFISDVDDDEGGGGYVRFTDVIAQHNAAGWNGGSFFLHNVANDVVFDRVHVLESVADGSGGGAAFGEIYDRVVISDSTFTDNRAGEGDDPFEGFGGGIRFLDVGDGVTIVDTRFDGNRATVEGGGVQFEVVDGANTFTRVDFVGNEAPTGGGLHVFSSSIDGEDESFTIIQSSFEGNRAQSGGGIGWHQVADDEQGPISAGLQLVVDSSSFWDNVVFDEGLGGLGASLNASGLRDDEVIRIVDSTFDEDAEHDGAFTIVMSSDHAAVLEVLHSTLSGPGGILLIGEELRALVSHTILTMTTADEPLTRGDVIPPDPQLEDQQRTDTPQAVVPGAPLPSAGGAVRSGAVSLAGPLLPGGSFTLEWSIVSTGVSPFFVVQGAGNQLETDPLLGALAENGGPTPTMLPGGDSPAINAGDPDVTGAPATDQRGAARITATIDIGAVETPAPPTLPATGALVEWSWFTVAAAVLLLGIALLALLRIRRLAA